MRIPTGYALGMTDVFCPAYLPGHCEEGPCPDAAIRIPPSPFFIIYYLFFILYSFAEPQSSSHGRAKE